MSIHEAFYIMLTAFSLLIGGKLMLWRRSVAIDVHYEYHGCDPTSWWAWPHNKGKSYR